MGDLADRAIEEEIYGERCMDCDETPCVCDDHDLDDACLDCGGMLCDSCGDCPDCNVCTCDYDEDDAD